MKDKESKTPQFYMRPRNYNQYNYVYFFMMLFITIFIVCDITAFRMTNLFGTVVPVSGLIIPVVFSLGDLTAEVYGYQISRKLIWNALVCQFIFGILITLAVNFPSPTDNIDNIHYNEAFKHIIRTNITSCISVSSGMFTNAFLMSKFKIWVNGKSFWIRTVLSSSISEFVLCFVAYTTLYVGLKSPIEIWKIILSVWYYKLIFALLAAPIVSIIASKVKKWEKSDVFDHGVNYNPFLYNYNADNKATNNIGLI
ncbi:transporter (plasmid) [Legionella antarctica]|uniref:Transporter n=1 Tax=Legionella antarctica TaxID=2708020 RepID=A0A6F8TAA8_9GAMM|nr:VUT family protein [Legionella antarctica]BCA97278.1 transporter [Legionella antarctica]